MPDKRDELREQVARALWNRGAEGHELEWPDGNVDREYWLCLADAALALLQPGWRVDDDPVRLKDCPPGLFLWNGNLCFRSEYATMTETNPNQPDAYVVESGEYFWGGASTSKERDELLVQPVALTPTHTEPDDG